MDNDTKKELGFALAEIAITKGIPALVKIIQVWGEDRKDVTPVDIDELKAMIKRPEEYMKD